MTDREKLVELLREVQYLGGLEEKIADHLLANGVIVLPCRVGDTVWQTDGVRLYQSRIESITIADERTIFGTAGIDFDKRAIGKTVFLTREKAEAALRKEDDGK